MLEVSIGATGTSLIVRDQNETTRYLIVLEHATEALRLVMLLQEAARGLEPQLLG